MNDLTSTSIYPDRPVYRAADVYNNTYPYANALGSAFFQRGNRVNKFNAASDSLSHDLAFQAIARLYGKELNQFYQHHPKFAEQANRHPFLVGGPAAVVGGGIAVMGGRFVQRLQQNLRETPIVQDSIQKILHSNTGNRLAKLLMPLDRLGGNSLIRTGAALGGLAFLADYLFRRVQDLSSFSKDYRDARKLVPESAESPYALKSDVLWQRSHPAHPES